MRRFAIPCALTLALFVSGCVLDIADAAYMLATGHHIDDGWYTKRK